VESNGVVEIRAVEQSCRFCQVPSAKSRDATLVSDWLTHMPSLGTSTTLKDVVWNLPAKPKAEGEFFAPLLTFASLLT